MTTDRGTTPERGASTRDRLIHAAEDLLIEAGSETAVSVRALERRAGVTAPTIYRHFPDMGALLAEVASRQFARLDAALARAVGDDGPADRIAAYGRAFARFGLEHPAEYRVLFMNPTADDAAAADRLREAASFGWLVDAVREAIARGELPTDEDAGEIASLLVMSLHGVVSLIIARPAGWADAEHLVERMMQAVGYGILPR